MSALGTVSLRAYPPCPVPYGTCRNTFHYNTLVTSVTCNRVGLLLHELPPLGEMRSNTAHGLERPQVTLDHSRRHRPLEVHHALQHLLPTCRGTEIIPLNIVGQ